MVSLLGRELVVVHYGLGWVRIFEFALVGLGWVSQMMGRVGSGYRKSTHRQLCFSLQRPLSRFSSLWAYYYRTSILVIRGVYPPEAMVRPPRWPDGSPNF